MNADGQVDRAYAGDLLGNMWVFDLSSNLSGNWSVAYKQGTTPKPLFTANNGQPITSQPAIVKNPLVTDNGSNQPNVLVLFGTGQYMDNGDNAYFGDQSFYGIWDDGNHSIARADLQVQTISENAIAGTRTLSNTTVDYSLFNGWYMDLNSIVGSGERVVNNPVVRGEMVYFNTSIPTTATCSFGGSGYLMSVDIGSGGNPSAAIFDQNGNGTVSDDTALAGAKFTQGLPAAPSFLGDRRYTPGTSTNSGQQIQNEAVEDLGGPGTGRLSWDEYTPY